MVVLAIDLDPWGSQRVASTPALQECGSVTEPTPFNNERVGVTGALLYRNDHSGGVARRHRQEGRHHQRLHRGVVERVHAAAAFSARPPGAR